MNYGNANIQQLLQIQANSTCYVVNAVFISVTKVLNDASSVQRPISCLLEGIMTVAGALAL